MTDELSYLGPTRVLSGVQPSGALHLGNYLGALVKFARLQHEMDTFIFVADMHAITVWQDPAKLADQTREIAAAYLAAGLDPAKAAIFPQSAVTAHAELTWIFSCVARLGWLDRMTQFKDKAGGKNAEQVSLGLLAYPSLMAADILVYRATHVPVGDDQKQHLELTRDIAQKFNIDFGDHIRKAGTGVDIVVGEEPVHAYFPMVEPLIGGPAPRVMSLRDGTKKMSKSDASDLSRINLLDDADTISKKIRKAKTDPDALPSEAEGLKGRPEAENLVGIYAALSDRTKAEVLSEFGGQQFSVFKPALIELAVNVLSPITDEMRRLMDDTSHIDAILRDGGERARARAEKTMKEVRDIIGFVQ
jgi:tryptophanyl-tRNA synthetase